MTPEDALTVRLDDLYRRVEDVRELKDEVKSLRRAIIAFAFSVAGSAMVFAFAVVQLTGSP
jgi:hypothetical protein